MEMRPCVKLVASTQRCCTLGGSANCRLSSFPSFKGNYYFVLYLRAHINAHAHTHDSAGLGPLPGKPPSPSFPGALGQAPL